MNLIGIFIFFTSFFVIFGEKARFDNYRVYSVAIANESQLKLLQELEDIQNGISYMKFPTSINQTTEIIVPPQKLTEINELFEKYEIQNWLKIENVQKLIDEEQPQGTVSDGFGWKQYYDITVIYAWLDEMLERYPSVLTNYNYGTSYENRTLRALKVSHKEGNPTIFIESTIHAREWITVATATYLLNELLTSSDIEIRKLADNYNWVFVPIVNVDGYAYTHSDDRMWRKTRQPYSEFCKGVDANRNFNFHHGEVGVSTDPCSNMYAGPSPFSEPETLALAQFIQTVDNIKLYIAFHSYGQLLLFPYAHTKEHVGNYDDLNQIAMKTKNAIRQRYQTEYTVGSFNQALYAGSATSTDWLYGTQNISLSYTFEFRSKEYGFLLPADQIIPNSLEIIDGLKAMIKEAKFLQYL